ncbi:MAG: hypothetical protein LUI05_01160 [Oscillospiraceae bacterium]|nr:hypothetical protein [Oscillospiraceae bacterium]
MLKEILRGILGGTVGMLIIGIFSGQWLMGAVFCYTVGILSSTAGCRKANCKK